MMEYYEHKLDPVGQKPDWLDDGDIYGVNGSAMTHWTLPIAKRDWSHVEHIRIPADHWAVPALKAGFKPCLEKPADYVGGETLWSNGEITKENEQLEKCYWVRDGWYKHVIGYRPKPAEQVQPSTPVLTEQMVRDVFAVPRCGYANNMVAFLREHGVLAEPTDPIKAALQDKWPALDTDALRETLAKHNLKIVEA